MGMVPMMIHPGAGGRGGGLHVQPPRGPPLVVGGGFHNPPPMQIVQPQLQHPQVFQVAPQQQMQIRPPLPMVSPSVPLPVGWSEHYTPQGLQYFFNAATGVSTYERPTMATASVPAQAPAVDNSASSTQANSDATGKWIEYKDDATGQLYYYHSGSKETVWEQPEAFRMQQAREEVERMKTVAQEQAAAEAQVEAKKKQEAEQKSKMYEHLSREERVALFKEFLEQKEISPQLKWQDAQRFIAKEGLEKDPRWRFALSSAGEKKQSFAEYCTQAINKQNIEKRRQVKKNREDFLDVLAHFESLFAPGSSFGKSESKKPSAIELDDVAENPHFYAVRQDPRWLVIEDQKEKRSLFNGFMQDIVRKHEQQAAKQKDAIKKRYIELLRKKADANEIALRGKRRLDSTLKQQLWNLLQELDDKENAMKSVEKYDVYDWSEELLNVFRDEEHEQRKRERELWRERETQQLKELEEKLQAMVTTGELTASSQWDNIRELLSTSKADDSADNTEEKPESEKPTTAADDQQLSERAQRRVFEAIIKELRLALQPTVDVVSAFLSKASSGTISGFEVQEACTFEAFADALTDGIRVSIDEKKPEDGEEEDETMEDASAAAGDAAVVATDSEKGDESTGAAFVALSPAAQKQQRQTELETLVQSSMESDSPSSSAVEFPAYVRDAYDMLVALAKEKKAVAAAPPATAANSQPSDRAVRSTSRSRKRRRDDGRSPSPSSHHYHHSDSHHNGRSSVSRSRSRPRVHKMRSHSRSPGRSRSRSKPKPLDRSVVWNTSTSSSSSSKNKFLFDPLNSDDAELTLLPQKPKPAPLTAEEERARAEEIIRQARLKLQAKQKQEKDAADDDGEELEEGEEPEEGEEEEE